jgi:hypothetical protein
MHLFTVPVRTFLLFKSRIEISSNLGASSSTLTSHFTCCTTGIVKPNDRLVMVACVSSPLSSSACSALANHVWWCAMEEDYAALVTNNT